MNTTIWVAQGILAAVFLAAGLLKLTNTRETLKDKTPYVEDFTDSQVKTIGTLEVLGAIGVVLPAALKVLPALTPIAACGQALAMVAAAATLIRRGEYAHVPLNVVIFGLAVFVAVERFGAYAL
jgi:uncharacterized membrane protein YphA (DoxX/SURF4 family)